MDEETTSQESVDSETPTYQKDDDSKTQELYIFNFSWKAKRLISCRYLKKMLIQRRKEKN